MSSPSPLPTVLPDNQGSQRIIGLTGGIGMGKSTVSSYLEKGYDLPVLDADILAREAVQVGSPILRAIVERYGKVILLPDGRLNRPRLGEIVFGLVSERLWLDQQIHPYVRDRFEMALAQPEYQAFPMIVLVVPLLFEARMTDLVTEIWVVHCSREKQIQRLMERSRHHSASSSSPLTQAQVEARINAQLDIQKKIERADVVLDNSGHQPALFQTIDQLLGANGLGNRKETDPN